VNADPEIATLIVDYVAVVADLWRAAGLRPGRARKDADPKYRSRFHRFVELVLTAIIDPWSRRHDDDVDKHARALFRAHSELRLELVVLSMVYSRKQSSTCLEPRRKPRRYARVRRRPFEILTEFRVPIFEPTCPEPA